MADRGAVYGDAPLREKPLAELKAMRESFEANDGLPPPPGASVSAKAERPPGFEGGARARQGNEAARREACARGCL